MNDNWYGIPIHAHISLPKIKLLFGLNEVIILPLNLNQNQGFLDFYAVISFFLEKKQVLEPSFGLLFDPCFKVIRKAIKPEFFSELRHENLLSLLEGDNLEAYYRNKQQSYDFLGVDLRFKSPVSKWLDANTVTLEILGRIREEKIKIYGKNYKKYKV